MRLDWREVEINSALSIRTSVTENEARRLRELARDKNVIEFGSAYGYSAIQMAHTAKRVVAVDPHNWITGSEEIMRENVKTAGFEDIIEIRVETAAEAYEALGGLGESQTFDLVFIDGDHSPAAVAMDFAHGLALLPFQGGVIACHDYKEEQCWGVEMTLDTLGKPDELVDTLWIRRVGSPT